MLTIATKESTAIMFDEIVQQSLLNSKFCEKVHICLRCMALAGCGHMQPFAYLYIPFLSR